MTDLKYTCDQIIDLDNKIRALVREQKVLSLDDVREFKRLKSERLWMVRLLQKSGSQHRS